MHLLSGKTLEARRAQRPQTIIQNGSGGFAMEFNGTDEYLTRALPVDIAVFNPANANGGWTQYVVHTSDSNVTNEAGSSKCIRINATAQYQGIEKLNFLTPYKKYKLKIRLKSTIRVNIGNNLLIAAFGFIEPTSQWNTVEITIVNGSDHRLRFLPTGAGTVLIESITVIEDWKMDLNESYELIKHSINRDFEQTLVTTYASNFTAGVDGFGVYSGNGGVVTGNIDSVGGENDCLKFTANAGLQYQIAVKPISQVVGKKYILKCKVYIPSTNAVIKKVSVFTNSSYGIGTNTVETYDQWVTFEKEGIALDTAPNWFYPLTSGGGAINNGSANGDVFYLKDVQVLEIPNLVTNGTFETTGSWTSGAGWAISGNVATHTAGTASSLAQSLPAIINPRKYRTVFTVSGRTAGSVYIQLSGGGGGNGTARTTNGTFTQDLVAGTASQGALYLRCSAEFDGSVDNVHLYEIPEWTATGNHSQNLSILDKSGATSQSMLITSSGAGRGAELLSNPNISGSSTGWTITNPAVVAYGSDNLVCTNLNNSSTLKPTGVTVTAGKTYEVIFTVTVTAGNIACVAGVGATGRTGKTVSGTYREVQGCINTGDFYLDGSGFFGTIESLSIKEYLGEVSLPSANIESVVSGKKYTLEGFARLDASSLGYANNATYSNNFDSSVGIYVGRRTTLSITGGELKCVVTDNTSGFGFQTSAPSSGKIYRIRFKAYSPTLNKTFLYIGNQNTGGSYFVKNPTLSSTPQDYEAYIINFSSSILYVVLDNTGSNIGDELYLNDLIVDEITHPTITAQLGTKSVTSSALSIVAGTFTKFVLNFEATASEQSQDLKLYLSGAGSVFVDKLSLTQRYDRIISVKKRTNSTTYQSIINNGANGSATVGFTLNSNASNKIAIKDYSGWSGTAPSNAGINDVDLTSTISYTDWEYVLYVLNSAGGNAKLYENGVLSVTDSTAEFGKQISVYPLTIGKEAIAAQYYLNGQISHIQIIRFENISQSTFNSAITGLQYPTGGGAEEVLRLTFQDGTTINNTLKDYSPMNHTITGVNIDSTNRRRLN